MADDADIAAQLQETANQAALKRQHALSAANIGPQPSGYCHNPLCGNDVTGRQLFCNADCATEYERLKRR